MTRVKTFEIVAQDAGAVRLAAQLGAARVELCQALALGGLTPSLGLIEAAVEAAAATDTTTEVHVLVRPRSGGFVYSADEQLAMERDVRAAVRAGSHGVVVGSQLASGELDLDAVARLRDAAEGRQVSLHRVIDVTPDPVESLEQLIPLGIARVLTSGGAAKAIDGAATLREMVRVAAGRIEVMAGSGVNAASVAQLWATGVDAVHFSAKRDVVERPIVSMGSSDADGVGGFEVTSAEIAREIIAALQAA
ncbi:copper homeostasis protein [Leucobacter exalbidus]|uniref:PF03932 family protein CutC n=1 Tax=Leucobacter exalbidus TaxID=662960 RepID=A0A940PLL2_9MICO|nr:copper homeostasis protein [Leucobacter exalbidus]